MKRYRYTIGGEAYEVEIESVEGGNAQVRVNGALYDVAFPEEEERKPSVVVKPKVVEQPRVSAPQQAAPAPAKPQASAGSVVSPLPGVVLRVNVKVGDTVAVGDTLLVLEAMKMENSIEADRAGVVSSIVVREGDSVMEGDTLVTIGD